MGLAAGVVTAETLVFAANGFHCPLTAVAKDLGDETGSVTDIYLVCRELPGIHVPLILAAVLLHWRNYRAGGGTTARNSPGTTARNSPRAARVIPALRRKRPGRASAAGCR